MTPTEGSATSPTAPARDTADAIEAEFHDHIRFILQREREEREQLDMAIREQVLARIQKQGEAIGKQMTALQEQQKKIEDQWRAVMTTADNQSSQVQGRIAAMADAIRKGAEPIHEYQVHAQ